MFDAIQSFRRKLDAGHFCLGPSIGSSDSRVVEALGSSVDFFWIDLEHSAVSLEGLCGHLIAARAAGTPALVRVPSSDVFWIKRVLDIGAEGIIVPQIHSAEEVRGVVAACRYPPVGTRGYGPGRPSDYGRNSGAEYIRSANQHIFVSVQIETARAYEELDAILAVPGLNSVVVGPQDLSGALGLLGQLQHPRVLEAITQVVNKARKAGLYVGMGLGPDAAYAQQVDRLGVQWLQCSGDYSFMIDAADQLYGRIRKLLKE